MTLKINLRWLMAFVVATVFFVASQTHVAAQYKGGFNKSGKSAGRTAMPQGSSSSQNRAYNGGGKARNRGYSNQRGNGYRYVPQGRIGAGHPRSQSHFHGVYLPISPYGNFGFNQFGINSFGYNRFGYSNYGLIQPYYPVIPQNSVFGVNGLGYNLNPAYATYGTYLNTGVLNSNVLGSSVAAQALQRSQNQQPIFPPAQAPAANQNLEVLRLQIELERAKQQLAAAQQGIPAQQKQRSLKIPSDEKRNQNLNAIEQLGLAPVLESNQLASASQLKAERAFRTGEYGKAARFSGLASSLDESNGMLLLFKLQAHFANGEFDEAVDSLSKASSNLPADQLGWVVQNFKLFYGKNDFVAQMKSLSGHLKSSPADAKAWLLRGFQYGALGYADAAQKDLEKAKDLGFSRTLVDSLISTYGSKVKDAE